MWSRLLALALLLLPAPALADVKEKVAALAPAGVVLVVDAEGNELVAQNADEPFVPASITKIVTAWLSLEVLGGNYRFETRFYLDDKRVLYVRARFARAIDRSMSVLMLSIRSGCACNTVLDYWNNNPGSFIRSCVDRLLWA